MFKLACKSLGCKLNQIETENIAGAFVQAGSSLVPWNDKADVYLINTCTVTSKAEQKARREIRLALSKNPHAVVIITGCYAELDADQLNFGPRALVIPGSRKNTIAELAPALVNAVLDHFSLEEFVYQLKINAIQGDSRNGKDSKGTKGSRDRPDPFFFSFPHKLIHTRPFLKIQDGCSRRCAYCRVCIARGNPQSLPPHLVLERVVLYEALGAPEIVLTGVNLSLYYANGHTFEQLLAFLIKNTKSIKFRLSSWEPDRVSDAFLDLFAHPRVQPHLHLSIQSGSDAVLRCMNRPYTQAYVVTAVERLRCAKSTLFLGADFISGFPGETEDDFMESLNLIHELAVPGVHAFTFSPRQGTPAYTMKPKVPERIAVARTEALIMAGKEERANYVKHRIGAKSEIILEAPTDAGMSGITPDYLRVFIPSHNSGSESPLIKIRDKEFSEQYGQIFDGKNEQNGWERGEREPNSFASNRLESNNLEPNGLEPNSLEPGTECTHSLVGMLKPLGNPGLSDAFDVEAVLL